MQINELCKRKALEQYFSSIILYGGVETLWNRIKTNTLVKEDILWKPFEYINIPELYVCIEDLAKDFQQIWNAGYTEGWDKSATFYLNTSNE